MSHSEANKACIASSPEATARSWPAELHTGIWPNLSRSQHGQRAAEYLTEPWQGEVANFLLQHFGYRAGNITYFRWGETSNGQPAKRSDHLVVPAWYSGSPNQKGNPPLLMSPEYWPEIRYIFVKGQGDETLDFWQTGGPARECILGIRSTFEQENRCILISDGEMSYRCLQFLWRKYGHNLAERASPVRAVGEWMEVLGLLMSDTSAKNGVATSRFVRMFGWLKLADGPSESLKAGCLNPTEIVALDVLDEFIEYLRLNSSFPKSRTFGFNILGHLALRCTAPAKSHLFPPEIQAHLQKIGPDRLDNGEVDRAVILLELNRIQIEQTRGLLVCYLGSHINISDWIVAADKARLEPFYDGLASSVILFSAKPLQHHLHELEAIRGRIHALEAVAHLMKNVPKACAATGALGRLKSLLREDAFLDNSEWYSAVEGACRSLSSFFLVEGLGALVRLSSLSRQGDYSSLHAWCTQEGLNRWNAASFTFDRYTRGVKYIVSLICHALGWQSFIFTHSAHEEVVTAAEEMRMGVSEFLAEELGALPPFNIRRGVYSSIAILGPIIEPVRNALNALLEKKQPDGGSLRVSMEDNRPNLIEIRIANTTDSPPGKIPPGLEITRLLLEDSLLGSLNAGESTDDNGNKTYSVCITLSPQVLAQRILNAREPVVGRKQ